MTTAAGVIMTEEMMRYLLKELSYETVVEETDGFKYRIQKMTYGGYQAGTAGLIQASLSIGLEMVQPKEKP